MLELNSMQRGHLKIIINLEKKFLSSTLRVEVGGQCDRFLAQGKNPDLVKLSEVRVRGV